MGELESKIRKHLGMFLLLLGILLFLGSLLGLANTVVWPEESLPYRLGNFLVLVSIVIIITGCIIGVRGLLRRGKEKKEVGGARRVCRECGKELKGYPEDVDICSRCRKRIEERKREILFSGKIRLVRILLGVMILLFAILSVIVSLQFIIFPLSLIVSIYLIKSRKSRLFSEAILTGLSITAFTGFSIIPFVPASPALFFKRFLPIRALGELFLIGPYVISTLTLTGTIFVFTVSLMKRAKRIGPKTSHIIVLVSTLLPFIIVTLAPTQPSPGPMISASMSGGARGNWLTWDSFPPGFLEHNETSGLWVYRISLASKPQNQIIIIINRISFNSEILNAPFSENIGCEGLEKTVEGIVFQPGARGQIIITLEKAFNKITLFDNIGNMYILVW